MSKNQKTTTVQKVPDYIEAGGRDVLSRAQAFANTPSADFTPDQKTAFQAIRDLVANAPNMGATAIQGAKDYAAAPAFKIDAADAMTRFFNPYVEATLQPAIRKIMEAADAQRKTLGDAATSAGAFGDARHGIVESRQNQATQTAIGDVTAKTLADAFNAAMGLETQQGQFDETAINRGLVGTGEALAREGTADNQALVRLQALLNSGDIQRTTATNDELTKIQALIAALGGAGAAAPRETETTKPDNSALSAIGSLLGAGLSPFTGGASLAALPATRLFTAPNGAQVI